MKTFDLRYFLTRFFLSVLLTLGFAFAVDKFLMKSNSVVSYSHADVSTRDPKVAEAAYWDHIYDYHKVVKHAKHFRFGKQISETWRYMDGREDREGISELDIYILDIATLLLIFMVVFSVVPVFLRKPLVGVTAS